MPSDFCEDFGVLCGEFCRYDHQIRCSGWFIAASKTIGDP
jgi:hypothetical protein